MPSTSSALDDLAISMYHSNGFRPEDRLNSSQVHEDSASGFLVSETDNEQSQEYRGSPENDADIISSETQQQERQMTAVSTSDSSSPRLPVTDHGLSLLNSRNSNPCLAIAAPPSIPSPQDFNFPDPRPQLPGRQHHSFPSTNFSHNVPPAEVHRQSFDSNMCKKSKIFNSNFII